MKINFAVEELWKTGFFENHKKASEVKAMLKTTYGMNPSNISVQLKNCKELRKESSGWIQRKRYGMQDTTSNTNELNSIVRDIRLRDACRTVFDSRNYWDTIFNATRHLEVRIREKSKAPPEIVGADLMEKVFKPTDGLLIAHNCATNSEQDGFKQILKGIMMYHRNAKGHREETIDKESALRILGYIDYLLHTINVATEQRQSSSKK